jgi:ribokinase
MAPQTIAVIGGLDADLIMIASRIPDRGESVLANEYIEALGGKGANSAIATYRTCHKRPVQYKGAIEVLALADDGIEVKMIGAVGDDRYGAKFMVELNKNGVDTSGIVTVPDTRSSVCFVMVEHSTHARTGACSRWAQRPPGRRSISATPSSLAAGCGQTWLWLRWRSPRTWSRS